MIINRQALIDTYLEWINNYITVQKFAEHQGLTIEECQQLIKITKQVFESKHPEA